MKIWRFYKKPKKDSTKRDYELYAITNNKKMAEEFIATRNMDLFLMKKSKEDKEDWIDFANENRGAVLDYYKLLTSSEDTDEDVITTRQVKTLLTYFEWQNCDTDQMDPPELQPEFWINMPPYPIFNDELIEALRNLEYLAAQRFYFGLYGSNNALNDLISDIQKETNTSIFDYELQDEDEEGDYSAPNIAVDELTLFIHTFKELLDF